MTTIGPLRNADEARRRVFHSRSRSGHVDYLANPHAGCLGAAQKATVICVTAFTLFVLPAGELTAMADNVSDKQIAEILERNPDEMTVEQLRSSLILLGSPIKGQVIKKVRVHTDFAVCALATVA